MKLPDLCLKRRIYNSRIYNNFDKITKKIKFTNPKHLIKSLVTKTSHGFAQVKQIEKIVPIEIKKIKTIRVFGGIKKIIQNPKFKFALKVTAIVIASGAVGRPVWAQIGSFEEYVAGQANTKGMGAFLLETAMKKKSQHLLLLPLLNKNKFFTRVGVISGVINVGSTTLAATPIAGRLKIRTKLLFISSITSSLSCFSFSLVDRTSTKISDLTNSFS